MSDDAVKMTQPATDAEIHELTNLSGLPHWEGAEMDRVGELLPKALSALVAAHEENERLRAGLKEALDLAAMRGRQVEAMTGSEPGKTSGDVRIAELRKLVGP